MLSTQSFDQLYVCLFVAVVCQDAQECFTFVQSFDRFTKTTTNTIMNHRQFENFLNSIKMSIGPAAAGAGVGAGA